MHAENSHSVTKLIEQLKAEDHAAADEIWKRYFSRLLPLARSRVRGLRDSGADEDDVLVSVFDRFFRAAGKERFGSLNDRDDLWQILLMLTDRKVNDLYRRSRADKRGGGNVASEAELGELNLQQIRELADREPGPEYLTAFNEHLARAIKRLGEERTREVTLLKLEGYSNREIADQLEISLSSIERKLRFIREMWEDEFSDQSL